MLIRALFCAWLSEPDDEKVLGHNRLLFVEIGKKIIKIRNINNSMNLG